MTNDAENPFMVPWADADSDVLRSACDLSQLVLRQRLEELAMFHCGMKNIHREAERRGIAFTTHLTAAEKSALEFITQNPLQN